jgi:hypothetical protein
VPQRLLLDRVFYPDHIVGIVCDLDADGSRRAAIDLANGGKCVLYATDEFWVQALGDPVGFSSGAMVGLSPPVSCRVTIPREAAAT